MGEHSKVLIAEDSSVIQNLTRKILEMQNYEISAVKNGQQVLDFIEENECDLILMDINMPVMDGMECTRIIREMKDDRAKTPIIAITGNARNYSDEDFKNAGINEFLQKPLDFDVLVETVKKYTS
jgi:hypothetical protein